MQLKLVVLAVSIAAAPMLAAAAIAAGAADMAGYEADLTSDGTVYEVNRGADGQLYISDYDAQEIWRVDPASGAYTLYQGVGSVVDARQDGAGNIWWTDAATGFGTLSMTTNVMTTWILTGTESLSGVAFDDAGHVWLSEWFGSGSKIHRFNPATQELCAYAVPGSSYSDYLLHDSGYLWLINWFNDRVVRFDPATREVLRWNIGTPSASPQGLALDGNGHLWWADSSDGLSRLDPANNQRTRYALPDGAGSAVEMVELRDGRVWYTESVSGTVGALDPVAANGITSTLATSSGTATATCRTLQAAATAPATALTGTLSWASASLPLIVDAEGWTVYQLPAGASPYGIAASSGSLWVTDQGRQKLVRFTPAYKIYLPAVLKAAHPAAR